jgi:hypothetical protein
VNCPDTGKIKVFLRCIFKAPTKPPANLAAVRGFLRTHGDKEKAGNPFSSVSGFFSTCTN